MNVNYINKDIILSFTKKEDGFEYHKLVSLLEELNRVYAEQYPYSSLMLLRAVLDHIPPLLGYKTFKEIVANYSWPTTEKKVMERLLDFRNEADSALHKSISNKQDHLSLDDLPTPSRINTLLQECLTNGKPFQMIKVESTEFVMAEKKQKFIATLLDENVSWANYSVRNGAWPSFRLKLRIDNYNSTNPDYVSVFLTAQDAGGDKWNGKHFLFQLPNVNPHEEQNKPFHIEGRAIEEVAVFISDDKHPIGSQQRLMPDLDRDTLKLIIETRSGVKQEISIKPGWIKRG